MSEQFEYAVELGLCDPLDPKIQGFSGDYRFLSNFWMTDILDGGILYRSSEHFYMSHKTFDEEIRDAILAAPTGAAAKKIGRAAPLRADWEEIKLDVMLRALCLKFTQSSHLAFKLLLTENSYLEETNTWYDTTWGVCNGVGKNQLGILLMLVRNNLSPNLKELLDGDLSEHPTLGICNSGVPLSSIRFNLLPGICPTVFGQV